MNNFEISLVVFMPNITTNHFITFTNSTCSVDGDDSYSSDVIHKGHQWLRCVSQRSGLPFWLLTSTLFLSIFFLIWLCCATATTAPREVGKVYSCGAVCLYS